MQDKEIIQKWLSGLSKEQLAKQYKRQYNMQIKNIRAEVKNRHSGRFITQYEALAYVEKIIYEYLKERHKNMKNKIYKIDNCIWFIAKDKEQLLEHYKKEHGDEFNISNIKEETNLQNGFWSAEDVTEELEKRVMKSIEEYLEEDEIPGPQEGDMWFCDNKGKQKTGTVRFWDSEFWVWITFKETLDKYKEPVKEAEFLCSIEF